MGALTFEQLRSKLQPVKFELEGGYVYFRPFTAKDLITLEQLGEDGTRSEYEKLAALAADCVVDDVGNPIFTAEQALQLPPETLTTLVTKLSEISGLGTPIPN
jgi:hypothetical protein